MQKILVLCAGNSCRSIIAEALINHLSDGNLKAVSAGSHPAGYVHPRSIKTLKRHGIDTDGLHSKSWDLFAGQHFDLVITVCDAAASESCPVFLGDYEKRHWSTPDPASVIGSEAVVDNAFDATFKRLKKHIEDELLPR